MAMMIEIIIFISGFMVGSLIIYLLMRQHQKSATEIAREINAQSQQEKESEINMMLENMKSAFGSLSMDALRKSTDEFLKLAESNLKNQSQLNAKNLEGKKELIDENLKIMKSELTKVEDLIQKLEKDRKQSYGELASQLKNSVEQTRQLQDVTHQLHTALSHSQVRGQWGERMAEDVLRVAGFIEGINYVKQASGADTTSRPDFTFVLPQNLKVNMDVKFPLSNYLNYLQAESDNDRQSYKHQFLRDVRKRIKEVTGRDYINPADNTVDYVIVFIPNEQVYTFINENDHSVLDDALKHKVILSSPVTLYAILAVIRQAIDNFNLEKTASEILSLLGEFKKQWSNFKEGMDKMGRRIQDAQKEFQNLMTTRTNQLERPLDKIETVRGHHKLSVPDNDTDSSGNE
ncbi:MAG: DNA recombination protein RmuC [Caldithrix sp.]|nr:DNA recombination protein RmuC [Caldithrix sp.]